MIKLLFIDDSQAEVILIKEFFKRSPDLKDVQLDAWAGPASLADTDSYDGVIIDQYLENGETGLEFAASLRSYDWLKPIMLYTGDKCLPEDSLVFVDQVCDKNDFMGFSVALNAFIMQIKRIKFLKQHQ